MRVIVTRPEREARQWVIELSAKGLETVALPLIDIGPVDDPSALIQAWDHLRDYVGVMFVSGNAARYFFAVKPGSDAARMNFAADRTRAWGPGPGTANALLAAGLPRTCVDTPAPDAGQFDSETLWQLVASQVHPGDRVLIVRGGDEQGSAAQGGVGRDWFAKRVAEAGATAEFVVSYQRRAPQFDAPKAALAQGAAADGSVWLFSSSEAVSNLVTGLPGQRWSGARALTTHPRIAAAARAAGFGDVHESRPTLPDVVAALSRMGSIVA
jgi:uroporphyrinogen-III synthase